MIKASQAAKNNRIKTREELRAWWASLSERDKLRLTDLAKRLDLEFVKS